MIKPEEMMEIIKEAMLLKSSKIESSPDPISKNISEEKLTKYSSEVLCSIIASNRYIKIDKNIEIMAMKELGKRRANGDNFNFEKQIDEYSQKFIPINSSIPEAINIASNFIRNNK